MNNTGIREAAQHSFGLSGAQLPENLEAWPENPVPAEPAAPPLDCEAAARRAAADAETGGPEGRPAFAAPKRRPPREGEINTGRILLRLRHDRVKVRSLAPPRAYGRARRARSPRRSSRARGDS